MPYDYEGALIWDEGLTHPHLGKRFDALGRFLPEHGNTVVAQVVPGSPTEAALISLRATLQVLPHAAHFAFTDVKSYHMTAFMARSKPAARPGSGPKACLWTCR